jgi:hypothetical protein
MASFAAQEAWEQQIYIACSSIAATDTGGTGNIFWQVLIGSRHW